MLQKYSVNKKGSNVLFLSMELYIITVQVLIDCFHLINLLAKYRFRTYSVFHRLLNQSEALPTRVKLMLVRAFKMHQVIYDLREKSRLNKTHLSRYLVIALFNLQ